MKGFPGSRVYGVWGSGFRGCRKPVSDCAQRGSCVVCLDLNRRANLIKHQHRSLACNLITRSILKGALEFSGGLRVRTV